MVFYKKGEYMKLLITIFLLALVWACGPSKETQELMTRSKSMFGALPAKMPGSEEDTPEKIALGEKLYYETALSANNSESCNTCHNLKGKGAGVDNKETSPGAFGKSGERNSPTVLNAGFHALQFWDGRAKNLIEQAKGPILNPIEMAMPSEKEVVEKLTSIEGYKEMFAKAYPSSPDINYDSIVSAIASFERTLITKDRYDDFIGGDHNALTKEEQKGLETFMNTGCTTCHSGELFGGKAFMKLGIHHEYENKEDTGKFKLTGNEYDKYVFKVPSLRNVALTAPYYHDGKVKTLEEAVEKMAYLQLGKTLEKPQVDSIVAFLKTLSDKARVQ